MIDRPFRKFGWEFGSKVGGDSLSLTDTAKNHPCALLIQQSLWSRNHASLAALHRFEWHR